MRASIIALLTFFVLATCASAAVYLRDEAGVAGLGLGTCVSALEDQDGDGAWELLVGAPGYQVPGQNAGSVMLWFGGDQFSLNADRIWEGAPSERFGTAVSRIGDVNGDGVGDWAVGAPLSNAAGAGAGRVYVFYGNDPLPENPDLILEGPIAGINFGWSIAALGDFNGDDRDDFVVGAPMANSPFIEGGAAYVFYGRNGDPNTTPDLSFAGTVAYGHFGWSVAGVAEFLGGNARCLAVGAPSHDTGTSAIQGTVQVFAGTTSSNPGPDNEADLTLVSSAGVTADNEFGFSVAGVGRFDSDSDPDLAVGIPFYSGNGIQRGRVEIFYGGVDADEDSDRYADGPSSNANFGWSVAGVGDVEGSSLDDVVIGAPFDDSVASNAGRAFIYAGGSGNVTDADALPEVDRGEPVAGAPAGDHFGYWCASATDLDGDGLADYAVSAPDGNVSTDAVAGWLRAFDSSGAAVPVQLGAWTCRWTDEAVVEGSIDLFTGSATVAWATFARLGATPDQRTVLHDGPPADGAAIQIDGGVLRLVDVGASAAANLAYELEVTLTDGTVLSRAPLAGPAGAAPAVALQLAPARPNPFNPRTELRFRAAAGQPVDLRIYDLRGRQVAVLYDGAASGLWQSVAWNGRGGDGRAAAAGIYLVRLSEGTRVRQQRLTLAP